MSFFKNTNHYKSFTINSLDETTSTNQLTFDLAKSNQINHNHVIITKKQTAGKGRYGRVWQSFDGNLYFSILLKPQNKNLDLISTLSFVSAVAIGIAINDLKTKSTTKISYKWPNDILINGYKTAGILLESDINQNQLNFVVIGIGVNIVDNPDNTNYPSTNLKHENFLEILPEDLLKKFLDNFSDLYEKWLNFGFKPIRNLWLENAFNLNKEISINLFNKKIKGLFKDLDENGNLILELENKENVIISSGEIFNH